MQLPCPVCGQHSDSLKSYRVPTMVVFLLIAVSFQHGVIQGCPQCLRKSLRRLALVNLLPANILWPLLVAPWYVVATIRSFTSGHSREAMLRSGAPSYRNPAHPPGTGPSGQPWHDDPLLQSYLRRDAPDEFDALFALPHLGRSERLAVRMLRRDGEFYRATLVRGATSEPGLHEGLEVFVQSSATHPPLVWVPPAAATNLEVWSARCDACQFDLVFTPVEDLLREHFADAQPGFQPSRVTTTCPACAGAMQVWRDRPAGAATFPAGLGETARKVWMVAASVAAVLSVLVVGAAGYSSESAGVAMSFPAAFAIGSTLGGWRAMLWARANDKPAFVPFLIAVAAGFGFAFLAAIFFFGIFPSL